MNEQGAAEPRWLSADEQVAWRALLDGTRLLFSSLEHQLQRDCGLTLTDYELMVRLSEAPCRQLRMAELAYHTLSTKSGVTRAVARLESNGWVTRGRVDNDGRGVVATLTDAGLQALADAAPGHVAAVREQLVDRMTPEQMTTLGEVMVELRDRLQTERSKQSGELFTSPKN